MANKTKKNKNETKNQNPIATLLLCDNCCHIWLIDTIENDDDDDEEILLPFIVCTLL